MAGERQLTIRILGDAKGGQKAVDEIGVSVDGLGKKVLGTAGLIAGGLGLRELAGNATAFLGEAESSAGKLQAQLGLTKGEAQQLGTIGAQVFKQGLGGSLTEVNQILGQVHQSLGLQGPELQAMMADVLKVTDAFGELGAEPQIITEDVRAMKAAFPGLTEAQALDQITASFQSGTGAAGDLQDTLQEYPSHFAAIGLSSQDMLNFLNEGMQAGARNTDFLADAVKEFGIRVKTEGDTAQEAIKKMFPPDEAERLINDFAKGGEAGRKAFFTVFEQLQGTSNEQDRYNLAVELFGTKAEDLVGVMDRMAPGFLATKDATQEVADSTASLDSQYENTGSRIEQFKRTLETSLLGPLGQVAPLAGPAIESVGSFGSAALGLSALGVPVGSSLKSLGGSILGLAVGPQAPFILAGVAAIGLTVLVVKNWDEIKAKTTEIWNATGRFLDEKWQGISRFADEKWTGLRDGVTQKTQELKDGVTSRVQGLRDDAVQHVTDAKNQLDAKWEEAKTNAHQKWDDLKTGVVTRVQNTRDEIVGTITDAKNTLDTRWEEAKTNAHTKWDEIKTGFVNKKTEMVDAILDPVRSARDEVGGIVKAFGNNAIGGFNNLLQKTADFSNKFGSAINWIAGKLGLGDVIPHFSAPQIPMLAKGARNFRGGLAIVGEEGPELVDLPQGANVLTARQTRNIMLGVDGSALGMGGPLDLGKSLVSGVKSLAGSVADTVSGWLSKGAGAVVSEALQMFGANLSLPGTFSQLGGPIVTMLKQAAVQLVQAMLDNLKDVLGGDWVRPLLNYIITQEFGPSSAGLGYAFHTGIDLAAPLGTTIRAAKSGNVTAAQSSGYNSGYGRFVAIDHGDGLATLYAHMQNVLARLGSRVSSGQSIGTVDSTGNSTGHHLHFELREGGKAVNPRRVLSFANGGLIGEHVVGMGMESGDVYQFGERGMERVTPGTGPAGGGIAVHFHGTVNVRDRRDLDKLAGDAGFAVANELRRRGLR